MLIAFAMRACAVRVIAAAVGPSFVVKDSPQDPVDALLTTRQEDGSYKGLIAVYSGSGKNEAQGDEFFAGNPHLDLYIQALLPPTIALTGADGSSVLALDATQSGGCFGLDIISRAIVRAFSLRNSPWSELFGRLVFKFAPLEWGSYLVETSHLKAPGREMRFSCDTLQEPTPGRGLSGFWGDFVAAMQADTEFSALASWVEAELTSPQGISSDEIERIFLGISREDYTSIGLGPLGAGTSAAEVPLTQVTVDDGDLQTVVTPDV